MYATPGWIFCLHSYRCMIYFPLPELPIAGSLFHHNIHQEFWKISFLEVARILHYLLHLPIHSPAQLGSPLHPRRLQKKRHCQTEFLRHQKCCLKNLVLLVLVAVVMKIAVSFFWRHFIAISYFFPLLSLTLTNSFGSSYINQIVSYCLSLCFHLAKRTWRSVGDNNYRPLGSTDKGVKVSLLIH